MSNLLSTVTLQDIAAFIVAIILTTGIVVLAFMERTIPDVLVASAGGATAWMFMRSVQKP